MITIKSGSVIQDETNVIVHQVNCQGVMGSGVAKQIREKYPQVYRQYKMTCDSFAHLGLSKSDLLGHTDSIPIFSSNQHVVNLFGQLNYGYDGKQYTDYGALIVGFQTINKQHKGETIGMPYKIGCDRGGGDWEIVYALIETFFKDCDVILYKYDGEKKCLM